MDKTNAIYVLVTLSIYTDLIILYMFKQPFVSINLCINLSIYSLNPH